ncbi:MAG: rhomboid family intramembrane serine protease [Acidobacteria bacterium]|nr:rhomboid family intramembrane serine protease [Acidobacteriota bacterium]
MLMPLGDDNSDRTITPYVTYALVGINILVFVLLQQLGNNPFTYAWSYVPREITTGQDLIGAFNIGGGQVRLFDSPSPVYLTLLSAMFMHGDIAHIGGNMLYLWIFGDNVEDRMGHAKFLMFYLLTGLLASIAQIAVGPNSIIPNLGASGAIAGVLGAYLILFPQKGIRVMMGYSVTMVPAIVVVGLWGLLQFIGGFGQLGREGGGVAYMAHVGGFVAGMVLVFVFRNSVRPMPNSYASRHFQQRQNYE